MVSPGPKSGGAFPAAVEQAGAIAQTVKAAQMGRRNLTWAWLLRLYVSRARVGVYGRVRIRAGSPHLAEGCLHMVSPGGKSGGAFPVALEQPGTRAQTAKAAQMGRRTLTWAWLLLLYVSRARVGVYGRVRIRAWPSTNLAEESLHLANPQKTEAGFLTHDRRAADMRSEAAYDHRRTDRVLADRFADAPKSAGDNLGVEAGRRAVEGGQKPVCMGGRAVGHKAGKSDRL